MSAVMTPMKETLMTIVDDLRDDRLVALLDYAEYLRRKQEEENSTEVQDEASEESMELSPLYFIHEEAVATGITDLAHRHDFYLYEQDKRHD
jgi:hypothetical protein